MSRIHPRCGSKNALWSSSIIEPSNKLEFLSENNDEPCWPVGRSRKGVCQNGLRPAFSPPTSFLHPPLSSSTHFPSSLHVSLSDRPFRSFFAHIAVRFFSLFQVSSSSSYVRIRQDDV